ncbi:MAG: hypothetical protein KAI17_03295 [Thiotrichaceae bacterium]|nr:hypothetical protein [Thiotrichaceae bacterium]
MSITNATNPPISYKIDSGTLTQADWDFLFQIFVEEDITVILDGITQTLNTDYTVAINGEDGGTVTFEAAVVATFTVGKIITLLRNLSATRTTSYQSTQRFDPEVVDSDMDRLTSLSGQLEGNFNQFSMLFPANYTFLNTPGYNVIPETWPNGQAIVNNNGTLSFAPIETNAGDPLLRSDLAVQVAPNEGSRLVGHTGETVYTRLNTNTSDIGTNTTQIGINTGNISTNTTNIGTNTTNIGTNTTDIATNTAQLAGLTQIKEMATIEYTGSTTAVGVPPSTITNQVGISSILSASPSGELGWLVTFANTYTVPPAISVTLLDTNSLPSDAPAIWAHFQTTTDVLISTAVGGVMHLNGFYITVQGTIAP